MGKLHKIRKAIEADPTAWFSKIEHGFWKGKLVPCAYSAVCDRGEWKPTFWAFHGHSYRTFVARVLQELGYNVK